MLAPELKELDSSSILHKTRPNFNKNSFNVTRDPVLPSDPFLNILQQVQYGLLNQDKTFLRIRFKSCFSSRNRSKPLKVPGTEIHP